MKNRMSFPLLDQQGPFATLHHPPDVNIFSNDNRLLCKAMRQAGMVTRFRAIRSQIFDFLQVSSFAEVQQLIHDRDRRQEVNRRCFVLLGNMFGLDGNEREIISTVGGYSRTADGVIRFLKAKVMASFASNIEMTNEIDAISSPVDLLLIIFDDRYHKKARFEAKRKLILMSLAGSIDQRERETGIESKFYEFLNFLNDKVWSQRSKIGELEVAYLLSQHDPKEFACQSVRVITPQEARAVVRKPGQKLTLIKRRRFQVGSREIPIYVTIRKKPPEAKVLKLLRKGEENPAVAVDDELGLMAVLDSVAEVKLFLAHLTKSALRADSFMALEEITDTLTGGRHQGGNIGSSALTPMFKFFARMGGMRVEFIIHSNKTYLNYIYQRDISHDEYEIKRVFDSGVAEMLFPQDIYDLDMVEIKGRQLMQCRRQIEES
ncbi:MAG: hypothetical protein KKD63_15540 [Proteobacteria bacterium]|nr:hypothetical protein [Desulfobulbaceae bacterium]MBU4154282.1 hypothetical protein [Pseudomonadota bacterium]